MAGLFGLGKSQEKKTEKKVVQEKVQKEVNFEDVFSDGAGTRANPYWIDSASQIHHLSRFVNEGNSYKDVYFALLDDIDLSDFISSSIGESWIPIGNENNPFCGIFDGGNHMIKDLKTLHTADRDRSFWGFFGFIGEDGIVKNLTTHGTVTGRYYTGGIAAINFGHISNCYNQAKIDGTDGTTGGIAGENHGTIDKCTNKGTVTGSRLIGGIAGANSENGLILSCSNEESVSGKSSVPTGGVTGWNCGNIENCCNTSSVSGRIIGGITGKNHYGAYILNCFNTGKIIAHSHYNAETGENTSGAIIGVEEGITQNCYFLSGCGARGKGEMKTRGDFASGVVAALLNSGEGPHNIWHQTPNRDIIPVLDPSHDTVLPATADQIQRERSNYAPRSADEDEEGITREQVVLMLWNRAGRPNAVKRWIPFSDVRMLSPEAEEAMRWAVENELITAYDRNKICPKQIASREEVAQMLQKFLEL